MSDTPLRAVVKINAQGRIVIPAEMRRSLGFKPGDELVLYQSDDGLRLETAAGIVRRVREAFAQIPAERDIVQELLERRRQEQATTDRRLQSPSANRERRSA